MACYVVTGGAGFIGSHIAARLVRDGHRVRVVDDLATGHAENLAEVRADVELLEGSVCDGALLRRAFEGAEAVFHQAALASVPRSVADPIATDRANVEGTLQVLEAARQCGVPRVVSASSSSVYGDTPTLPKREDMPPTPMSPYAASKLAAEHYCRVYAELFGLQTVSLRYFNVFGPRQDPAGQYAAVIPLFIAAMLAGKPLQVFGDGEQSRDFTYVDNVVEVNLLAAQAEAPGGLAVNVGCGERHTLNDLIRALEDVVGTPAEVVYASPRPGDVLHSEADIQRARDALGFEPKVGFEEGLRRTVDWHRAKNAAS